MSSLAEYIKHTRHFDGLGMGDQDLEQRAQALEDHIVKLQERCALQQADNDAGRELMRRAWHEFNAIRARDGAPVGVSEEYWSEITDMLADLLGDDTKPWMTGAAKALISAALEQGRNDERERCAQVAEGFQKWGGTGIAITAQKIAKAIRGQS